EDGHRTLAADLLHEEREDQQPDEHRQDDDRQAPRESAVGVEHVPEQPVDLDEDPREPAVEPVESVEAYVHERSVSADGTAAASACLLFGRGGGTGSKPPGWNG